LTRGPVADGVVDGSPDRWRQRDEHYLAAFATDAEHSVAVFLEEILDRGAACLEDPQPK
jgi:hypothetical protein